MANFTKQQTAIKTAQNACLEMSKKVAACNANSLVLKEMATYLIFLIQCCKISLEENVSF